MSRFAMLLGLALLVAGTVVTRPSGAVSIDEKLVGEQWWGGASGCPDRCRAWANCVDGSGKCGTYDLTICASRTEVRGVTDPNEETCTGTPCKECSVTSGSTLCTTEYKCKVSHISSCTVDVLNYTTKNKVVCTSK